MPRVKTANIRTIVIDDSQTARELMIALFEREGIHVIGSGASGLDAVRLTSRLHPDVICMDANMPEMDGLEATRRIMHQLPTPIVIVTASLMQSDMDLTFEAMQAGALTVVRKPGLADPETCDKLVETVRLMAGVPVVHHWDKSARRREKAPPAVPAVKVKEREEPRLPIKRAVEVIAIASSTGGPVTLATLFRTLPANYPIPILVVQHITRGFTGGLAEWLSGETALQVGIAGHGERLQAGMVLIAPDDYHMQLNARKEVELSKEPAYKGLRPSANFLFRSLARNYGSRAMGIVLTGMGDDGAEGLALLHKAGGLTVAQNEASCVVFGMPQEAIARKAVDRVLSPEQIVLALGEVALQ